MRDEKTNEWLEPQEGIDMSASSGRLFKKDPAINVISKEDFEIRVEQVFHLLWKTLAKSFGPYGAPTLIYNYPWSHVTKDGYTIMKNLSMDASETKVDQAIADMAGDICGRLNYTVGDGTTSSIIATNSIYQNYRCRANEFKNKFILPRDVIRKYGEIKDKIIDELKKEVTQIRTEDREQLRKNIKDVVYISSNGDELMTEYISDLYYELGSPAITCTLSPDGITRKKLIEGYKYEISLTDRLYINNEDNTMSIHDADIVIFGTKITEKTYRHILKPLNEESRMRKRKLIVAAPGYDEVALQQVISVDLNNEYKKLHSINMVLTTYRANSSHARKLINDFAVLMNTTVIDRALEGTLVELASSGTQIAQIFNIDERDIQNLTCVAIGQQLATYNKTTDELPESFDPYNKIFPLIENAIDLGYIKSASLGMDSSLFTGFVYDEERYKAVLSDAKHCLEETEKKYQKLGTFNVEVSQAQNRLYALNLKMGVIEVGADSELSQKLLKDAVDDSIKAASSAFNHGVILGCNVTLIRTIEKIYNETTDEVEKMLIDILKNGFKDVYKTMLGNAFDDISVDITDKDFTDIYSLVRKVFKNTLNKDINEIFTDLNTLCNIFKCWESKSSISIHDIIVEYSLKVNKVLDISKFEYNDDVINSAQTDEEILKATIDLITLLIVGNQMVVTQKHNF